MTITYGVSPAFSIFENCDIEMPCDDALWLAPTESQWEQIASLDRRSSRLSLKDALKTLLNGNSDQSIPNLCLTWSPFAIALVMHAVATSVWHLAHGFSVYETLHGASRNHCRTSFSFAAHVEESLSRCRALLTATRNEQDSTWNDTEGPLLFNAFAVLRVTYGRAFTSVGTVDRTLLLQQKRSDMLSELYKFVIAPQERNECTAKAVARASEGLKIPVRAGHLLTSKTAALSWSIEHALAGWDAGKAPEQVTSVDTDMDGRSVQRFSLQNGCMPSRECNGQTYRFFRKKRLHLMVYVIYWGKQMSALAQGSRSRRSWLDFGPCSTTTLGYGVVRGSLNSYYRN